MLLLPTQSDLNRFYEGLGTSEKQIAEDVTTIVDWIKKQPQLSNVEIDKRMVEQFILYSKNDLERTKDSLSKYYSVKSIMPKFFSDWDPTSPELIQAIDYGFIFPLPKPTREGYRVCLGYYRSEDYKKFSFVNYAKVLFMNLELRVSKVDVHIKDIMIWDLKINSLSFITDFLRHVNDYMYCINKVYPLRLHQIHLVNVPTYAMPIINLVRKLLKQKIADRFVIHKDSGSLTNYIDPSVLPINYGGTFEKHSDDLMDEWKEIMIKHKEFLISRSANESHDIPSVKKSIKNSTVKKKCMEKCDITEID